MIKILHKSRSAISSSNMNIFNALQENKNGTNNGKEIQPHNDSETKLSNGSVVEVNSMEGRINLLLFDRSNILLWLSDRTVAQKINLTEYVNLCAHGRKNTTKYSQYKFISTCGLHVHERRH
jgi:hypothetical protein